MKRLFNKQYLIALFFFFLFVLVIVADQLNLFKALTTVPVVIAVEKIDKDTVIDEGHVAVYQMDREIAHDGMLSELEDVVGRTATSLIQPSQYVSQESLDQTMLRPTNEHEFFPIPNAWLVEIQGTLRRYDLVNISSIYVGNSEQENKDVFGSSMVKGEYILEGVPVAFVKGGKNDEITGKTSGNDRLYGSQNPSNIELSLTLEEFKELEKLYLEGYRFVFSY